MYHAHFGLKHGLTGDGIAADADVFRSAKHDRLVAHFKLALANPSSCIVLQGPAGVGKTTLTAAALRATSTRLAIGWVGGMATNSSELLELLLVELGVSTARTTRMERLQLWRQYQGEMRATDSRLFVVVERTEDLSHEVLHALDQLTAPDASGNCGANVVFLGHPGIQEHLAAPLLDSLRQRIRLRVELEPFTEDELQGYLRHQVAAAGGSYERMFAAGAVAALHRYTRGVARLANTLCESALDIAAVQQQKQLTGELVAKTAVTLLGLAEPVSPVHSAAARPVAAAPAPRPAAHAAPIFERRSEPRLQTASVSPLPPEPRPAPPPPSAPVAAPPPTAALPAAPAAPPPGKPVEIEFDGSVTDVADVALADFPVLTDAVEPAKAMAPAPAKPAPPPPAPAPPKAATSAQAAPAAAAPAPKPAAKPANRVETAPAAARPPSKPAPSPTPLPHVAAAKAAAASAAAHEHEDDVARQTQTVRAIAEAKSLHDISDTAAETLFGDAELDLVSAALASAADWPDDDDPTAKPAPALSTSAPASPAKPAAASGDAFDLFGLDDNAPLELIDDSTLPPANPRPKTAIR
jgi:type II secretory pathway predicted ATPase ExeA